MDNNLRFEEFFADRLRERGLNPKRLSELSGVATKHIEALCRGDFAAMPPAPYFRGYLNRLGQILNFDPELWWKKLEAGGFIKSSGKNDEMPRNRFVNKISSKPLLAGILGIAVIIYLLFALPKIFGKPQITITFPPENPAVSGAPEIVLSGTARNTTEIRINSEFVNLAEDGSWEKATMLVPDLNSFEIRAKKFLGGETKVIQQIIYQPTSTTNNF